MSELNYINLVDLLHLNLHNIESIKNQYLLLLSNLTSTEYIETKLFKDNIEKISQTGTIIVGVIIDSSNNFEIVASGTIIIEPKIIRGGRNVGHIEDIVVADHMRGQGVSQKILDMLRNIAREKNCYKIILDCDSKVKNVYIKNGFEVKGIQMAQYFV
jgi:glucosamine-phosphate N-acetyltransferase